MTNHVKAEELVKLLSEGDYNEYHKLRYRALRLPEAERNAIELEASSVVEKLRRALYGK